MTHRMTEFLAKVDPTTGNSHTNKMHPDLSTAGAWISQSIPKECYKHFVTFQFFDGTTKYGNAITPTAGNIVVQASSDGRLFGDVPEGIISLGSEYKSPNFTGAVDKISVTITGLNPPTDVVSGSGEGTSVLVQIHSYS